MSLTVAVTGPTGDLGRSLLRALDRRREVGRVLGMARRPFDPASLGLKKTEYRQGDILDRAALDDLFAEADVVVHLAFILVGSLDEAHRVNLQGSRNVFEAAAGNCERVVYTSSVAAYGFHGDNPTPLTEDVEPRGSESHYYSAQKAELEAELWDTLAGTDTYVFRPCVVAGEDALTMIDLIPFVKQLDALPWLKPVLPNPPVPFQLVHAEDVASALVAAVLGRGEPGVYNLAAEGELRMSDFAAALGWYSVPVPAVAVDVTAELIRRAPLMPPQLHWIQSLRQPIVMDCAKARSQLRWRPKHDARATLMATVSGAREAGLI